MVQIFGRLSAGGSGGGGGAGGKGSLNRLPVPGMGGNSRFKNICLESLIMGCMSCGCNV